MVKVAIPTGIFKKIEPFGHLGEAVLLNLICGFPGRRLKVIGVTGTNGKTTTSFLIHRMMHEAGYKVGLMTTVAYGVGVDIKPQVEHMTTVSVPQLLRRLKTLRSEGAEWLVLETTSHSLAQHRVWGVPFSIAVMTNITHEHLDYHGSFENYRAAKLKMFKMAGRNRKGMRLGIVNADDPAADSFQQATPNSFSYGIKRGELKASDIKMSAAGNSFTARSAVHDGLNLNIRTHLPGSFNIHNSLAAIAVGLKLEIEQTAIEKGIASLSGVEGRMATVNAGQNFDVIVDYAHTPDSFEKLFSDLRPMIKGKMIVMFGSAGRRDEAKRAIQGNIAGRYADVVVVTEEDDRDIDGTEIMDQIAGGAQKAGKTRDKDLFLVHDRAAAIKFALSKASKGDTVLLLGKGHEKTIARAHGEDSWDEVATAQKILTVKR